MRYIFYIIVLTGLSNISYASANQDDISTAVYEFIFNQIEKNEKEEIQYYFISFNNKYPKNDLLRKVKEKSSKVLSRKFTKDPNCTEFDNFGGAPEKIRHTVTNQRGAIVNIWTPRIIDKNRYSVEWIYRSQCSGEGSNYAYVEKINGGWVVTSSKKVMME